MLKRPALIAVAALAILGACKRTESGDVVIKRPTSVDVKTTPDTLHMPSVTTKTDTINAPVVGTQKETVVVNKPVVGSKKTQVKVPVVTKPQ
jgi:hypothetical protein